MSTATQTAEEEALKELGAVKSSYALIDLAATQIENRILLYDEVHDTVKLDDSQLVSMIVLFFAANSGCCYSCCLVGRKSVGAKCGPR